jgi:hypothetical protein
MKKKIIYYGSSVIVALTISAIILYAQGTGTPSQLRVILDSTGALVTAAVAQTLPLSQPITFNQARLRTDATGALVTVGAGTSSSSVDLTRRIYRVQISDTLEATITSGKDGMGINGTTLGSGINTNTVGALRLSYLFSTTNSNGNTSGWANNGLLITRTEFLPSCTIKIGTDPTTIAAIKYWIGLSSSQSMNTDTPTTTNIKFIGFRFSSTVPDTNWMADIETGTSSLFNRASTGVAVATNTFYTLKFEVASTTSINFYVNGTLTNNLTTNIPTGTSLFPIIFMVTTENVVKNFNLSTFYCETN